MSRKQTTARGFQILSAAGMINKFLALAYLPIQTAIVGDYGNGLIASGYKIYIFIFSLSNAGLPIAISKMVSEQNALGNYSNSKRILKVGLIFLSILGCFYGSIMALGAGWISKRISQPDAYLMILALSPTFIFTAISSAFRGYFQGNRNMVPTAVSQVIEQLLNSILTVVFAALLIKYGVDKAAAGTTIGTSVGAMVTAFFLAILYLKTRRNIPEIERRNSGTNLSNMAVLKLIALYSLPALIGTVSTCANDLIDSVYGVSRMMSGGIDYVRATELFGIYSNQFQRLINVPLSLTTALSVALIPSISEASATKNYSLLGTRINESFRVLYILIIPCVIGCAALAQPIINFIFFNMHKEGADLIIVGSWIAVLMATLSIQTSVLLGLGKPFVAPINLIVGMLLKIGINYSIIQIPSINIKGAIFGTAIGWFVACLLNHYFIKKYTRISIYYGKYIYKTLIASVLMGVAAYVIFELSNLILKSYITSALLLNDIALFIAIIFAACIYFFLLILSGSLVSEDIIRLPFGTKILHLLNKHKLITK